jgi:pilus assembly protein CpaB
MRSGRTLVFVLLIIIIGLVVGYVAIRQFLVTPAQPEQQASTTVEVYIAVQPIPQGGKITEDVLSTIPYPQDKVNESMFTQDKLAALLTKVAKYPLEQGVIITVGDVSDASAAVPISGPQWASLIPPGMTAMSLPITRLSVMGYGIDDGAHINLNACFLFVDVDPSFQTILPNLTASLTGTGFVPDTLPVLTLGLGAAGTQQGRLELDASLQQPFYLLPSEPQQRPRMVCQMLLQDAVVMKLGNFTDAAPVTTDPAAPVADPAAAPVAAAPDIITLIVSPQDSITLSYLMYTNAQISMTLRNPTDQARNATEAATLQFLLSQYNIPVPAKLPYAMQPALTADAKKFESVCLLNDRLANLCPVLTVAQP